MWHGGSFLPAEIHKPCVRTAFTELPAVVFFQMANRFAPFQTATNDTGFLVTSKPFRSYLASSRFASLTRGIHVTCSDLAAGGDFADREKASGQKK